MADRDVCVAKNRGDRRTRSAACTRRRWRVGNAWRIVRSAAASRLQRPPGGAALERSGARCAARPPRRVDGAADHQSSVAIEDAGEAAMRGGASNAPRVPRLARARRQAGTSAGPAARQPSTPQRFAGVSACRPRAGHAPVRRSLRPHRRPLARAHVSSGKVRAPRAPVSAGGTASAAGWSSLHTGQPCSPSVRIRGYRGVGRHPGQPLANASRHRDHVVDVGCLQVDVGFSNAPSSSGGTAGRRRSRAAVRPRAARRRLLRTAATSVSCAAVWIKRVAGCTAGCKAFEFRVDSRCGRSCSRLRKRNRSTSTMLGMISERTPNEANTSWRKREGTAF